MLSMLLDYVKTYSEIPPFISEFKNSVPSMAMEVQEYALSESGYTIQRRL